MRSKRAHALGLFLLFSLSLLFSKSDAGSLGVYWGQNAGEGHLSRTCKTGLFRIVNIAFLSTFGNGSQPLMNLAGHCSHSSNGCERVGRDIRYCQRRGIKVCHRTNCWVFYIYFFHIVWFIVIVTVIERLWFYMII